MKTTFLQKSYTKFGGETIPRPFSKKSKLSISLYQLSKVLYSLFLFYAKLSAIEIILALSRRPLAFTLIKVSKKEQKEVSS